MTIIKKGKMKRLRFDWPEILKKKNNAKGELGTNGLIVGNWTLLGWFFLTSEVNVVILEVRCHKQFTGILHLHRNIQSKIC